MKSINNFLSIIFCLLLISCTGGNGRKKTTAGSLVGTWQLLSTTIVENGQTTYTDYTKNQRMIKVINDTHFAFLKHEIKKDKADSNSFDAGGGRYKLTADQYVEFLDFYKDGNWEGKTFTFRISFKKDTLIQTGIEKVDQAGVNRTITEKYIPLR
jgi:hypothetical protein